MSNLKPLPSLSLTVMEMVSLNSFNQNCGVLHSAPSPIALTVILQKDPPILLEPRVILLKSRYRAGFENTNC